MGCGSTIACAKAIEKRGRPERDGRTILSETRYGILLGMWGLFLGMESTPERASLANVSCLLRAAVFLTTRVRDK